MIEVHIKVVLVQLQIFASTSYKFGLRKTYKKIPTEALKLSLRWFLLR